MDKKNIEDFINKVKDNTNDALEDTLLDSEAKIDVIEDIDYSDIVKNNTKAMMSKLPWLISIFLILIISVVFGFMFFNNNPQTIFTNTIDKFFIFITDNISDNNYDISKGNIKAKFDIKSPYNSKLFDEISKLNFDVDYALDNANGLSRFKVISLYENDDPLDLYIYNDNKNLYLYSKNIYDKYLKIDNGISFKIISPKDIKTILNGLNQAFDKVPTAEIETSQKTNLDTGIKTLKVYETKLVIDSKNYERVSETFINTLKSNEEVVSAISDIRNISNSDVKKALEGFIPKLKKFFKDNEKFEIKLYNDRKSKDFIKGEMVGKLGSFVLIKNDNNIAFSLLDSKNNKSIQGDITIDVNKAKTKYDMKFEFNEVSTDNANSSGNGQISFTNNKASSLERLKNTDVISFNELSDIEKFGIYTKLFTDPNLSKLLEFVK